MYQRRDRPQDQTLAFEGELNVVHTVIDRPQGFHNSVPPVWESTHIQYSLVRMHGRNDETWNIKGAAAASDRCNYDYPYKELDEIAARVERLARQDVHDPRDHESQQRRPGPMRRRHSDPGPALPCTRAEARVRAGGRNGRIGRACDNGRVVV